MKTRLHISAADGTKPRRFRIEAYNGGLLPVDGFEHPVVVDLRGLETPNNVPILIDHRKEVEATLGITDAIENTGSALMLGGLVTGVSDLVQTVLAQDAKGQSWQASIGARVLESTDVPEGQVVNVNGQQIAGPFVFFYKKYTAHRQDIDRRLFPIMGMQVVTAFFITGLTNSNFDLQIYSTMYAVLVCVLARLSLYEINANVPSISLAQSNPSC